MWPLERICALALITLTPALIAGGIFLIFAPWFIALVIFIAVFGLGLDVCLTNHP